MSDAGCVTTLATVVAARRDVCCDLCEGVCVHDQT